MITINDIGKNEGKIRLHFNNDDEYMYIHENHPENFLQQFSDEVPKKYSEGGRYLMMECDSEETFKELVASATKIPGKDSLFEFSFGELPTVAVQKDIDETRELLRNAFITGRTRIIESTYGHYRVANEVEEIEYKGKKYIYYNTKLIEVKPIKWIIDVKNHKIKSENVVADPHICGINRIIFQLRQPLPKVDIPYNISNGCFRIKDGVIEMLKLEGCNSVLNIPNYIKGIDTKNDSDNIKVPECLEKISFPRDLKEYYHRGTVNTKMLEIYDSFKLDGRRPLIRVYDVLTIHYSTFDKLFIFLNGEFQKLDFGENFKETHLYGEEKLTPSQEQIVKNYLPNYKWYQEPIKKETSTQKPKETITPKKDQKEEPIEKNELSISLEKLYKILTYYKNGEEETRKIKEEVSEYKQKLKDLEKRFYAGEEDIETPEALYNEFIERIKDKLATYEKDTEYHKIIDLIEMCESAIKGESNDINIELIGDLYSVSNVVLPYLKDSYHKYYKKAMLDILSNEMNCISNYLNKRNDKPKYTTEEEFLKHFITLFNPLLIEINLALNDESTKRNIAEEIMKVVTSNMSLEFEKARYGMITHNLKYLHELSKTLDEKIAISPFAEKYYQDKKNILAYAKNINSYYGDKSLREELISACSMLKKYLRKKPEEFIEIDNLVNDIIKNDDTDKTIRLYEQIINIQSQGYVSAVSKDTEPESIPFDKNNSETHKIINALYEIIRTLQLLELEVDGSIEKKQAFTRCKIID